jgi:hypothetical protein
MLISRRFSKQYRFCENETHVQFSTIIALAAGYWKRVVRSRYVFWPHIWIPDAKMFLLDRQISSPHRDYVIWRKPALNRHLTWRTYVIAVPHCVCMFITVPCWFANVVSEYWYPRSDYLWKSPVVRHCCAGTLVRVTLELMETSCLFPPTRAMGRAGSDPAEFFFFFFRSRSCCFLM